MNTFPLNQDEYAVEEISYDDMMSILSTQGNENTDIQLDSQLAPESESSEQISSKQDDVSRRIAENAKQNLPEWLLNH